MGENHPEKCKILAFLRSHSLHPESSLEASMQCSNSVKPPPQGVALWIMHHKKHYRATVRTWHRQLVAATNSHKLALLYLANDVVQNARKKQPEIEAEFGQVWKLFNSTGLMAFSCC